MLISGHQNNFMIDLYIVPDYSLIVNNEFEIMQEEAGMA
jgi:hypothetical protein